MNPLLAYVLELPPFLGNLVLEGDLATSPAGGVFDIDALIPRRRVTDDEELMVIMAALALSEVL